jgi:hypothetical protein
MRFTSTAIQASCPACGAPIKAEVRQVIDVGQEPELRRRLLRGQLNVGTCPSCSSRVAVATPLAYHDPAEELFLILIPGQMSLSGEEQDKIIGELTNLVMDSLPPEQRKGYLFQPKTFFSMDSLISEILRTEGITDEMIQDQMQKAQLLRELLAQSADAESFKKLVQDKKDSLDYQFFLFLSASIDQAREDGEKEAVEELSGLRNQLNELVAPSPPLGQETFEEGLTREELVDQLFAHKDDELLESLVALARPALDYQFFQTLTARIEAVQAEGDGNKAKQLTRLRSKILDLVDELDKEAKAALDRAAALLRRVMESENLEAVVEKEAENIDAAFLTVLEANLVAARQAEQKETAEKLAALKGHTLSVLEARLPPEMRLINQLVANEGLEERRQLVHGQPEVVNEDFLKLLNLIIEDLRAQGQEEAAERLSEIVPDVEAMVETSDEEEQ